MQTGVEVYFDENDALYSISGGLAPRRVASNWNTETARGRMVEITFAPLLEAGDFLHVDDPGQVRIAGDYGNYDVPHTQWLVPTVCDLLSGLLDFMTNQPTAKQYIFSDAHGTFNLKVLRKNDGLVRLYSLNPETLLAKTNASALRRAVYSAAQSLHHSLRVIDPINQPDYQTFHPFHECEQLLPDLLAQWLAAFPDLAD